MPPVTTVGAAARTFPLLSGDKIKADPDGESLVADPENRLT